MKRTIKLYLDDILESIELIQKYTVSLTEEEFGDNVAVQDAVLRRLEIIGEASNHLPEDVRQEYSNVPWKKVVGMRNLISHEYFAADIEVVWDTVKIDLPKLKIAVERSTLAKVSEN